jgi:ferredoxin
MNQPTQARNADARRAALAAVTNMVTDSLPAVRYQSRGRVVVIGDAAARALAARIEEPLRAEVLNSDRQRLTLSGHLGAFHVELGDPRQRDAARIEADLVVDFGSVPLVDSEIPPPGYWRFAPGAQDLEQAAATVSDMVGTFEKPRYFVYDPAICAHARAGQPGCTRCIEACPAEAIVSIGERIEVNPHLCQGGGACASACPSGAIRYAYPAPEAIGDRLRTLLRTYRDAGGSEAVVLFVADPDLAEPSSLPANVLPVTVEELASTGHDLWLSALAWGADRVLLADDDALPGRSRATLDAEFELARDLLGTMGYPNLAIDWVALDGEDWHQSAAMPTSRTPARHAATAAKRQAVELALDHLWRDAPLQPSSIALAPPSPYGAVSVDPGRCTLCMACTSVCPVGALSAGGDTPRLVFNEARCVQCGICDAACPEDAVALSARWLTDPAQRRAARTLHEEPPFCCVACGKPFATRHVIDAILGKLSGHAMYQSDRARRRLQMCEDCRVVDAVQDSDAVALARGEKPRAGAGG